MSALTFLGLALRAGRLVLGEETCGMAARAGKAKLILTASDAGRTAVTRAGNFSAAASCPNVSLPCTKEELGAALGRGSVGVAALTDTGLASAFMDKLAAEFDGFDEPAAELRRRAERARARRVEAERHEANIRRGKKRK